MRFMILEGEQGIGSRDDAERTDAYRDGQI